MALQLLTKLFGSSNQRTLKTYWHRVQKINEFESSLESLSDEQLKAKTAEFKEKLQSGIKLDDILPEAFAVVREVSRRVLGLRHFDVQLIGGMTLHDGKVAEMATGEGKTLTATLPAYLNALTGEPVFVVTVNDYLAKRDADWMKPVYNFLGLEVGIIVPDMSPADRHVAYSADIIYATNNELGFDYLRDQMVFRPEDRVQAIRSFAIIDEADSVLIDEARTPLIISGKAEDSSQLYMFMNQLVTNLKQQVEENGPGDFSVDEKQKQAYLTEEGHVNVENMLKQAGVLKEGSLYDAHNMALIHHLLASIRAHNCYRADVDYIVQNGEVVIVDEHTGRTMPGRRWSDGLHQALEAKSGVKIKSENQTLASITFQNYFRLFDKISGMTGTADTEAYEMKEIYDLDVVVIPTNKPNVRIDEADEIYLSQEEKFDAIVRDIKDCQKRGQPALVGTISIESSELLSKRLQKEKITHKVLNAKYHEKEAEIVADAGMPGAVTIATNMAGRGTDIVLGGSLDKHIEPGMTDEQIAAVKADWQKRHDAVVSAGGLRIIGTERHDSRRIDNQLRGRSARQGDPGASKFYLAMDDELMRKFASEKVRALMRRLGVKPGEAISHTWVTNAVARAQGKVEGYYFDIRKQLLEYDNVANDQREVIYLQRAQVVDAKDISENINSMVRTVMTNVFHEFVPQNSMHEMWNIEGLDQVLQREFLLQVPLAEKMQDVSVGADTLLSMIIDAAEQRLADQREVVSEAQFKEIEKSLLLSVLDHHWKEHLSSMDYMRRSIHLRGYAQKDPKQEYKREAFAMFASMLNNIKRETISALFRIQVEAASTEPQDEPDNVVPMDSVSRNQSCPCGSGKKYKACHGRL